MRAAGRPIRLIRSACCASADSGQVAAAPQISVNNSRRLTLVPHPR